MGDRWGRSNQTTSYVKISMNDLKKTFKERKHSDQALSPFLGMTHKCICLKNVFFFLLSIPMTLN